MIPDPSRLEVTYSISAPDEASARATALEIALEQTVEVPHDVVSGTQIEADVVGQLKKLTPLDGDRFALTISYDQRVHGSNLPQLINVLFGNISLKQNIRITDVDLPVDLRYRAPGPNFGVAGLRERLGVYARPLAATALKPLGSSPDELAAMAAEFARGGCDLIKDDHGLADQSWAPFQARVTRCQAAVDEVNAATGRNCIYLPNLSMPIEHLRESVEFAIAAGVQGVLLSPGLIGWDTMRFIAQTYPLVVMAHPALTGTLVNDDGHGIAHGVLLGKLFRLAGADISIFPNPGGRFGLSPAECGDIADALRVPMEPLKPAWPAPAGGMTLTDIPDMAAAYGPDAVYLIGGALLQASEGLAAATARYVDAIRASFGEQLAPPQRATPVVAAATATDSYRDFLAWDAFRWEGRSVREYKQMPHANFAGVTRHELTGKYGEKTSFDLRYFELEPGGYSSREKHVHEHVIIAARGVGVLEREGECQPLRQHDVAHIGPMVVHQLRNESDEPFGFYCIVDHLRDRPIKV